MDYEWGMGKSTVLDRQWRWKLGVFSGLNFLNIQAFELIIGDVGFVVFYSKEIFFNFGALVMKVFEF